jgi:hypothetical protein
VEPIYQQMSGLSAKGIEIGFMNFLVDPKVAVSSFVENVCDQNFPQWDTKHIPATHMHATMGNHC